MFFKNPIKVAPIFILMLFVGCSEQQNQFPDVEAVAPVMLESHREHAAILDAIRAKDVKRATAALKQNIQ